MKINIEENFEVPKYSPTQIVRILKRWAFINKCRIESETPSSYLKIDASQIIYPTGINFVLLFESLAEQVS